MKIKAPFFVICFPRPDHQRHMPRIWTLFAIQGKREVVTQKIDGWAEQRKA